MSSDAPKPFSPGIADHEPRRSTLRDGGAIEIRELVRSSEIDKDGRGNLAAFVDGRGLTIHGWTFGNERRATDVELVSEEGEILAAAPICLDRPDVVAAIGDLPGAGSSGFMITVEPARSGVSRLGLRVIFEDGEAVPLGAVEVGVALGEGADGIEDGLSWLSFDNAAMRRKVLTGRDGWLFLQGDTNDAIGQHTGRIRFSDEAKTTLLALFENRRQVVAAANAAWVTAVAPDKEVIYAEHLPEGIALAERRPIDDVLDIAEKAEAPFVYLLDPLRAAKSKGELYMRTDTHWNHRGAFIAYEAICNELVAQGVELKPVSEEQLVWKEVSVLGDLGEKLYPHPLESTDVRALLKSQAQHVYDNEIRNHGRVVIYEQELESGPTCVVFGESFAQKVVFFLKESFQRLVFVHTSMLIEEVLEMEKPDAVVGLPVERFLIDVPDDTEALARLTETARSKGGELPWQV